jgi:hypothetical protein
MGIPLPVCHPIWVFPYRHQPGSQMASTDTEILINFYALELATQALQ